jgi:hypothetical protein
MSKPLAEIPNNEVYSFIQKSLDRDQLILNHMLSIEKNVENKFTEMSAMVKRVEDSVSLIDAECYDLKSVVFQKSIDLTKDRYQEEDGEFSKMVGVHRRLIWKKLKERFKAARYTHIRRIDFENAVDFVRRFRIEDYI